MKRRKFRFALLALLPLLASCTQSPPATLTSLPADNDTAAVSSFLQAAVERFHDGLTCGSTVYTSHLGISEADFLAVAGYTQQTSSSTSLYFRGKPYLYRAYFQTFGTLRGTVTLGPYLISFDDPQPGVTRTGGGIATVTTVYEDGNVAGEDEYYDQTLNFFGYSVGVIYREAGEVRILDIYYKPDCAGSQPHLTLALAPVPNPR
jgi:hypothetical protein